MMAIAWLSNEGIAGIAWTGTGRPELGDADTQIWFFLIGGMGSTSITISFYLLIISKRDRGLRQKIPPVETGGG
jgi:hypothetical protein